MPENVHLMALRVQGFSDVSNTEISGLVTCRVLLPPLRKGFSTKFPFPLPPAPGSELGAVAVESSGADVPGGAVPSCVGMVVCGKPQGALLVDGPLVNPLGP